MLLLFLGGRIIRLTSVIHLSIPVLQAYVVVCELQMNRFEYTQSL